jgi:hypothetical protein
MEVDPRRSSVVAGIKNERPDTRQRLQEIVDTLCDDAARVKLWACALSGFAQPVPDYSPMANYRLGDPPKAPPNRPR